VITDGPFLESKEFLAGFWIVEAADRDTALNLVTDGSEDDDGRQQPQANSVSAS
jgi:hypothetical protein